MKPKQTTSIGLDIGTSTVKFVKLRFLKDAVEVASFASEPVQMDLTPVLKKITQGSDVKKINLSVSGPATVLRYVPFPKMNNEELKKALKFEAQKYIPFPIAEVSLDSGILKEDLPDNKMLVLLAAVRRDFVNLRIKSCEAAGLKVGIVDIDSIALINAFNFNNILEDKQKDKAVALLNIGAQETNLSILEGGLPRLSRDIHIADNNFTQKIAEAMGVDFKIAESLKADPEKEKDPKINAAVESVLSNLAKELRISCDYYESQSASSVGKVFLSGGGSLCAKLKDMLTNFMGVEVEHWDPFKKINIAEGLDSAQLKSISAQFAVAVGLALRG